VTWVRISDSFEDQLPGSSPAEWGLWLWAKAYANRRETDGFVPFAVLRRFGPVLPKRLEEAGAFLRDEARGGYEIVGHLAENPSKAELEASRTARSEAGRLGGLAKARKLSEQLKSSLATAKQAPSNLEAKPYPDPDPQSPYPLFASGASAPSPSDPIEKPSSVRGVPGGEAPRSPDLKGDPEKPKTGEPEFPRTPAPIVPLTLVPPSTGDPPMPPRKPASKSSKPRETTFPDGFAVSPAIEAMARKEALPDPHLVFRDFRDWALAKGKKFVDWEAAFRNWMRSDITRRSYPAWKESARRVNASTVPPTNRMADLVAATGGIEDESEERFVKRMDDVLP